MKVKLYLIEKNMIIIIISFTLLTFVSSACTTYSVRKEIRNITLEERREFFNGFVNLMSSGQLDDLVWKHTNLRSGHATNVHYTPLFLPWHRLFLKELEDKFKSITNNPRFALPYWDWTIESQDPYNSNVFSKEFFGTTNFETGNVDNWEYNRDSIFYVNVPIRKPLQRFYKRNYTFTHKLIITQLLNTSYSFSQMATNLENIPHANVHNFFSGDMNTLFSPNDPVFWMHHVYVDKLWYDWQFYNNTYKFDTTRFFKMKNLNSQSFINNSYDNYNINATLNSNELCIYYSDNPRVFNSEEMSAIKGPTIPLGWFNSTNANITQIIASINSVKTGVDNINNIIENNGTLPDIKIATSPNARNSGFAVTSNILTLSWFIIIILY